ncbi:MAG: GNAT family N-acetyltransferase [bacterium]|nr:GNAT family N-acetyltransferase [bacterium]
MSDQPTVSPDAEVTLREVTKDTFRSVIKLSDTLSERHQKFVASNLYSIAEAYVNEDAWVRAVYADDISVGFMMISDKPEEASYFLWRFMIGGAYQGMGFGRKAIDCLVEHVKTRPGATELLVSCGQGEGSPEGFYVKLGFEHTGEKEGSEVVLKMEL